MWQRQFPLLPPRRQGSVLWEKAEGDGSRVKQVPKPPSPGEKLACTHLTEEERCHLYDPTRDRRVEGEEMRDSSFAKPLAAASRNRCQT